jgi:UDP-N-acetylmuramate dehydrogenase
LNFSYRHSALEELPGLVLSATFRLVKSEVAPIREKMQELIGKRRASQPLELPSAGSAFKRPKTGYAAALIDQSGLRGYHVGGAAVSEKHAGFVVNIDNATACEVRQLLTQVAQIVREKTGVELEPEVRIW